MTLDRNLIKINSQQSGLNLTMLAAQCGVMLVIQNKIKSAIFSP